MSLFVSGAAKSEAPTTRGGEIRTAARSALPIRPAGNAAQDQT
jgi:hypothetical protein